MLFYEQEKKEGDLSYVDLKTGLYQALDKIGNKKKVLVIPPDFTRFHSRAGELTYLAWEYYRNKLTDILPALGTHAAMSREELAKMFGQTPLHLFRVHDWQKELVTLGEVPADYVKEVSEGKVSYPWPAQVNKLLVEGNYDLILSIGQVVPHEVIGMANYNKNIFIGTGGLEGINKSHFLGAVYGMERIMGRIDTPVRKVLNYASDHFTRHLPIVYVQTVVSLTDAGKLCTHGLYIGDDSECFAKAARLSLQVNFRMLDKPLKKVVVHLDPEEFKSFWLGNKSIYRTRMAIEDDGELIVLAPGVKDFAETLTIDKLVREYGYVGTPRILEAVKINAELQYNLSAAAHLIHGSSEGRFRITYCPGYLTPDEVSKANFSYGELGQMLKKYNPAVLKEGYNSLPDGEEVYYISNPAVGLWACRERFKGQCT